MRGWRIGSGEALVWLAHLPSLPGGLELCLDREEQERAARFVQARDRDRFTAAHGLLRRVLGLCLGTAGPDIEFERTETGKPYIGGRWAGMLEFNMSHSGDYALIAVTTGSQVGVDLERIAPVEHDAIITHFATEGERRSFADIQDRMTAFYGWWTRKEACLKARGSGLGSGMDGVEIDPVADVQRVSVTGAATGAVWTVAGIPAPPGYAAASCVEGDRLALRIEGSDGGWRLPG